MKTELITAFNVNSSPLATAHINDDACQIQYKYTSTVINNDLSLINLLGSMFKSLMDYVIACEHDVTPQSRAV